MILVVHPDKNLRHFLTSMIKDRLDEPVFAADSMREMVWHLQKVFFDLILLPRRLEDGDGFELIKQIRRTHNRFKLPIIMVSSAGDHDVIAKALEVGANDCITVPLMPVVALSRIKHQLKLKEEHRHLLAQVTSSPTANAPLAAQTMGKLDEKDHTDIEVSPDLEPQEPRDPTLGSSVLDTLDPISQTQITRSEHTIPDTETIGKDGGRTSRRIKTEDPSAEFYESDSLDKPIPCEMPVSLFSRSRNFFCKTLWISRQDMLVLTFEEVRKEKTYKLQMLNPKGGSIDLEVVEMQRQPLDDHGAGVLKLNLKITKAPQAYDEMTSLFYKAFDTQGIAGLKSILRGEEKEETDLLADTAKEIVAAPEEQHSATMIFSSAVSSLNITKGKRYKFEKQVGRGGFACVYLVQDNALKRPVAMKVLNQDFSKLDDARYNFLCEAQIAAQFHHPNIVFVYEVGELFKDQYESVLDFPEPILHAHPARLIYFTMQYVEGVTLTKWIRNNPSRKEADCVRILLETAKALAFAHDKGVIHRDIKPDNIMLSKDDHVQVTDFGIATLAKAQEISTDQKGEKVEIACTPKYASPEQLRGKELDGRSDIYSFGVLAYELITGKPPFHGGTLSELVGKQLRAKPKPIRDTKPDINAKLEEIILKCLAKKTEDRPDAAELLSALSSLMGEKGDRRRKTLTERLEDLLSGMITIQNSREAARALEQLTAFLQLNKTDDNAGQISDMKQKLSEASILNLLIEQNLNNDNQQLLYEFFIALDSSSAVMKLLQWFRREKEPWKKLVLSELAVLSAGRDLKPLAVFGLELADDEACILLKGFAEVAGQNPEPVFVQWAKHRGYKTQKELLKTISITNRPNQEIVQILDYFANKGGSTYPDIHRLATQLLAEKQRVMA